MSLSTGADEGLVHTVPLVRKVNASDTLTLLRSIYDPRRPTAASTPFAGRPSSTTTELALILGEPHATVHRALADLLADGITGRVSHGSCTPAFEPEVPPDRQWHP